MEAYEPLGTAEPPSWTPQRHASLPSLPEPPRPQVAYADDWRWPDPTPPLPQPWPVELQLDRRSWRPRGQAALRPGLTGAHRRTGAFDHPHWVRSSHFVQPGLDVAYQTYKAAHAMLSAQKARPDVERPPRPADSEAFCVFPDLFWALGNPPLLSQRVSRAVCQALSDEQLLDAFLRPTSPVTEAQVSRALSRLPEQELRAHVGADFALYGAIALNVIYDLCAFGDAQTALRLYRFRPLQQEASNAEYDPWSRRRQLELDRGDVQRRAQEVDVLLQDCAARLREALDQEALEAAAVHEVDREAERSLGRPPDGSSTDLATRAAWIARDAARQARVDARVRRPPLRLEASSEPSPPEATASGRQMWQVAALRTALPAPGGSGGPLSAVHAARARS